MNELNRLMFGCTIFVLLIIAIGLFSEWHFDREYEKTKKYNEEFCKERNFEYLHRECNIQICLITCGSISADGEIIEEAEYIDGRKNER